MAEILEKEHDRYLWWKHPNIPEVKVRNKYSDNGLGHLRKWLETELPENHKIVICFHEEYAHLVGKVKFVYIAFDYEEDYTAFKLVFPEYC